MFVFNAFFIFVLLIDSRINAAVIPLELDKNDDIGYCIYEEYKGQITTLIRETNEICDCHSNAKPTCNAPFLLNEFCDTIAPIYRVLSTSVGSCKIAIPEDSKQVYGEDVCDYCIREDKKNIIKMQMDKNITSICKCFRGYYTHTCNSLRTVTQNPKLYDMLDNYCAKTVNPLNLILSRSTGPFKIADIPYISADIPSNTYHIKPLISGTAGSNHNVSNFVPYKGNISKDDAINVVPPRDSKLTYINWNFVTAKDDRPKDDAWNVVAPDVTKPEDVAMTPVIFNGVRPIDNGSEPALPKSNRSKDGETDTVPPEGDKPKFSVTEVVPPKGSKPKDDGRYTVSFEDSKTKDGGTSKGVRPKDNGSEPVLPKSDRSQDSEIDLISLEGGKTKDGGTSKSIRPRDNGTEPVLPKSNRSKDGDTDTIPPNGTHPVSSEGSKPKDEETDTVPFEGSKTKGNGTSKGDRPKDDAWSFVTLDVTKPTNDATLPVLSNGVRAKYHRPEPAVPKSDRSKGNGTYPVTYKESKPKDGGTDMISPEGSTKYGGSDTIPDETYKRVYDETDRVFPKNNTKYGESATVPPEVSKPKYGEFDTVTPKHSKPIYGGSNFVSTERSFRSKDPEPLPALPNCGGIDTVRSEGGKPIKGNTAPSEGSKIKDHEIFSTSPKVKPPSQKPADTNLCFLKTINQNIVSRALCVLKALNQEN